MKKSIGVLVVALTVVAGYLIAESVSKPTLALSKVSPSGGMEMRDMIIDDLDTLATAIATAAIDGGAGSFTVVVSTGDVKGASLSIGAGSLVRVGDALNWIEDGVTNTVVADVTN